MLCYCPNIGTLYKYQLWIEQPQQCYNRIKIQNRKRISVYFSQPKQPYQRLARKPTLVAVT